MNPRPTLHPTVLMPASEPEPLLFTTQCPYRSATEPCADRANIVRKAYNLPLAMGEAGPMKLRFQHFLFLLNFLSIEPQADLAPDRANA